VGVVAFPALQLSTRAVPSSKLTDDLNTLCAFAAQGGADRAWLNATADSLVEVVLLARQLDARHRRSLAQARQMAIIYGDMRQQGHTPGARVAALCARSGLKRSRIYELRKLLSTP
jgi:hypothetical protein